MKHPWERKSIVIRYKDGMITTYAYSTETFKMIAENKDIIARVEIQERPLFEKMSAKDIEIKITGDLYEWLTDHHGGHHCPKYAVLSRMVALIRKKETVTMSVSQHELDHLPENLLKLVKN